MQFPTLTHVLVLTFPCESTSHIPKRKNVYHCEIHHSYVILLCFFFKKNTSVTRPQSNPTLSSAHFSPITQPKDLSVTDLHDFKALFLYANAYLLMMETKLCCFYVFCVQQLREFHDHSIIGFWGCPFQNKFPIIVVVALIIRKMSHLLHAPKLQ